MELEQPGEGNAPTRGEFGEQLIMISPAYAELNEYISLRWKAEEYINAHPELIALLKRIEKLTVGYGVQPGHIPIRY